MSSHTNESDRLIQALSPIVESLGYEIIHLEVQTHRGRTLRIFIDHKTLDDSRGIGIEDCVKVTHALEEPLEALSELDPVLQAAYELEVSSPGVDRPLGRAQDYMKFKGREVRIHVFRPLSGEELKNLDYGKQHPKQKHFVGRLENYEQETVWISLTSEDGAAKKPKPGKKPKHAGTRVAIPLNLIAKANLEPHYSTLKD